MRNLLKRLWMYVVMPLLFTLGGISFLLDLRPGHGELPDVVSALVAVINIAMLAVWLALLIIEQPITRLEEKVAELEAENADR